MPQLVFFCGVVLWWRDVFFEVSSCVACVYGFTSRCSNLSQFVVFTGVKVCPSFWIFNLSCMCGDAFNVRVLVGTKPFKRIECGPFRVFTNFRFLIYFRVGGNMMAWLHPTGVAVCVCGSGASSVSASSPGVTLPFDSLDSVVGFVCAFFNFDFFAGSRTTFVIPPITGGSSYDGAASFSSETSLYVYAMSFPCSLSWLSSVISTKDLPNLHVKVGPTFGQITEVKPVVGPLSSVPAAFIVPLSLCVSCVASRDSYERTTSLGEIIASWGEVPNVKGSNVSQVLLVDLSLLVVVSLFHFLGYFISHRARTLVFPGTPTVH